jgi:2'-5' RNA ligase
LKAYAQNLSDALRSAGFDIERRAFRPHITIARQVETTRQPNLNVPKTTMTAGRVSLMKWSASAESSPTPRCTEGHSETAHYENFK